MELNKYIGDKIKRFREVKGLTQDDLAKKLGTTRQSISRYETGDRKANQDILFELAEIFNVKVDDFFPKKESVSSKQENSIIQAIYDKLEVPRKKNVLNYAQEQLNEQNLENKEVSEEELLLLADEVIDKFGIETLQNLMKVAENKKSDDDSSADNLA